MISAAQRNWETRLSMFGWCWITVDISAVVRVEEQEEILPLFNEKTDMYTMD